jgi:hypothetical protein
MRHPGAWLTALNKVTRPTAARNAGAVLARNSDPNRNGENAAPQRAASQSNPPALPRDCPGSHFDWIRAMFG